MDTAMVQDEHQQEARAARQGGFESTFTVHDLAAVRCLAAELGRRAGLGPARLSDFVLAINEAATSAVCHGCDRATLRLWACADEVYGEVRGGRWVSGQPPPAVPDDTDSLRLWVVWQVCDEVTMSCGPDETTVLVSVGTR
jgi:hypothetical protein